MSHRLALAASLGLALILTACAAPGGPQPVPSTTSSGGASDSDGTVDDVHGWLVTASTSLLTGTARLCAVDIIWTDPDDEYAGIYVEENGGPPDGLGDAMYNIDPRGINLHFNTGKYEMDFLDGNQVTAIGTRYTYHGTFTFTKNDDGVPIEGSGTGTGKILHEDGNVDNGVPDALTFTFTPIPEPDWCTF